jgi:hypothetical protein
MFANLSEQAKAFTVTVYVDKRFDNMGHTIVSSEYFEIFPTPGRTRSS